MGRRKKELKEHITYTVIEQKFITLWDGKICTTCKKVPCSYSYAQKMYRKEHIKQAIRNRDKTEVNQGIAKRQEIQEFWSEIMRDESKNTSDRLKASENLAKSKGMFVEKVEVTSPIIEQIASERLKRAEELSGLIQSAIEGGSLTPAKQINGKQPAKHVESKVKDEKSDNAGELDPVSAELLAV